MSPSPEKTKWDLQVRNAIWKEMEGTERCSLIFFRRIATAAVGVKDTT